MSPFSPHALAAIVLVGLLTFGLGLLLSAFSPEVFGPVSAGNDSFSRSLVGHRALIELLRRSGLSVVVSRGPAAAGANRSFPLLLLETDRATTGFEALLRGEPAELRSLDPDQRLQQLFADAHRNGATAVFALPKWRVRASARLPGWIEAERARPAESVAAELEEVLTAADPQGLGGPAPEVLQVAAIDHAAAEPLGLASPALDLEPPIQLLAAGPGLEPLVHCDQGVLIGRLHGDRIAISDPDLFNNRGLARGDHAALMLGLLADVLDADGVVVEESIHGHLSSPSLLAHALGFPLGLVTLHVLLAMLLAAWAFGSRLGKPRPPPPALPPGKRLLIDNTARLLLAGGEHADALRRYMRVTLARQARRFALTAGQPAAGRRGLALEHDLIPRLQAVSDARGVRVDLADLVRRCERGGERPAEAVRLARQLYAWRRALQQPPARRPGAAGG